MKDSPQILAFYSFKGGVGRSMAVLNIAYALAAKGRHEELLKTNQLYRRMCARRSVGKSLDDPETVDELIQAARQ